MEATFKAIIGVFNQVFNKKNWAILYILAIAFGILWKFFDDNIWISAAFVIFGIGAVFHLIIILLSKVYEWCCAIKNDFLRKKNHRLNVWSSVKFLDQEQDILEALTELLDKEKLNGDKYIRCLSCNFKPRSVEERKYYKLVDIASDFGRSYDNLIEVEHVRGGTYFRFDKYFYKLIEHYRKKNRWEKI